MKLDRLEIAGFKSFVDPVTLEFAGGITAIVGPNGCGKSNLSEAMTWVLGEQSAKSLRGGSMADVIFNGSERRKPLGMADATLVLEADPSFPAAEEGRLSISRRVFSSGEGQYRLNGKRVRLKEIKDLLMDTGLGIRAYSVIEQGKIGMVLSGKPQERRKLIEEAAGITRYKARKRIAEIKLEESLANLLRLDDILEEVERSLRSLKRQASAARRYKQKQEEYRDLLRRVLTLRARSLLGRLAELEESLAAETATDAETAARVAREEAELAAAREEAERLAAEVADRHRRQAELAAKIEGRQEFTRGSRRTLEEIEERLAQGRLSAERRGEEAERLDEEHAELVARREALVADAEAAAGAVSRDEEAISEAGRSLAGAEARLETLRKDLLAQVAEVNGLGSRVHQGQIELEKGQLRRRHLGEARSERDRELEAARAAREAAERRRDELGAGIEAKRAEAEAVASRLDETVAAESAASDAVRTLERRLSETRQRHRLLDELAAAHRERRSRLLAALSELDEPDRGEPEFLGDRLRAVPGWERSLDVYLSGLADAVVLGADESAAEVAERLEGAGGTHLLRPLPAAPEGFPTVDDPAVTLSLGEALGLDEGVAAALPPAYLVDAPADAERLAREHPGVAFLSRDGLWAEGGLVHLEPEGTAPGLLERERELAELAEAIESLGEEVAAAEERLEGIVARRAELAGEGRRAEAELAELEREAAVAGARLEDVRQRLEQLEEERASVDEEAEALDRELEGMGSGQRDLSARLEEARRRHAELEERFDAARQEVETAKAHRESLKTASADRRGHRELLRERLVAHDRETARLAAAREERERQREAWEEEAGRLERRRLELEAGIEEAERELAAALEARADSEGEVREATERLDSHRARLKERETRLATTREERDAVRGRLEELRVERAGLLQDREHLAATYLEAFGPDEESEEAREAEAAAGTDGDEPGAGAAGVETPDGSEDGALGETEEAEGITAPGAEPVGEDSDEEAEPSTARPSSEALLAELAAGEAIEGAEEVTDEPRDLPRLEVELARSKATLERLGPVNILAVDEYAEQEERHGFLTEQRADVARSVESLKTTIREINETSSERFRETFAEVNRNFGEVFTRLFRGGEAQMELLDEEDLLESGIEIVARPPGKRLQNLMLLSGGEKALTAIALLFALFRAKPSPFCILDEVDAPLDDVNTVRFVELLQEMAEETQFLVITHNKITMQAASTLYGVTMQEKGVSKLVAVELEKVQPEEPQARTA